MVLINFPPLFSLSFKYMSTLIEKWSSPVKMYSYA